MSDSEASAGYRFDDDSGSEGYVASPKVTKQQQRKLLPSQKPSRSVSNPVLRFAMDAVGCA